MTHITPKELERYFKTIGLDYEKSLLEVLKSGNTQILEELKNTVKSKALLNPNTQDLVDWITQQQFWQNAGEHNQFTLLFLLARYEDQIKKFHVASLFPRKRNASEGNYRIGLKAFTERFGELGIEAKVYGQSVSLQIFTEKSELLKPLVSHTRPETDESFRNAGYNLLGIEVSATEQAKDFELFLKGQLTTEVDLKI